VNYLARKLLAQVIGTTHGLRNCQNLRSIQTIYPSGGLFSVNNGLLAQIYLPCSASSGMHISMISELISIADEIDALLPKLVHGGGLKGSFLPNEHAAHFKALILEAKSIIDHDLGPLNDFSWNLSPNMKSFGSGPTEGSIQEASRIVRSAARATKRKETPRIGGQETPRSYVDPSRIEALQALQGGKWDFTRLVELCRELNVAAANNCHMSTAMLIRTILNHVPPIFGFTKFDEVANNYGGPKNSSFRGNMQKLSGSLKNIADRHLHTQIRTTETLPTFVQVDFAADLDVLLEEIIRVCRSEGRRSTSESS
jgi:hypothetical protein